MFGIHVKMCNKIASSSMVKIHVKLCIKITPTSLVFPHLLFIYTNKEEELVRTALASLQHFNCDLKFWFYLSQEREIVD
jgi:hypothetical protein